MVFSIKGVSGRTRTSVVFTRSKFFDRKTYRLVVIHGCITTKQRSNRP